MMNLRCALGEPRPGALNAFAKGNPLTLSGETWRKRGRLPSQNPLLLTCRPMSLPLFLTHENGFQVKVRHRPTAFDLLIAFAHAMVQLVSCKILVALNRFPVNGNTSAFTVRLPIIAAPSPWLRSSWTIRVGNNSSLEEPR